MQFVNLDLMAIENNITACAKGRVAMKKLRKDDSDLSITYHERHGTKLLRLAAFGYGLLLSYVMRLSGTNKTRKLRWQG